MEKSISVNSLNELCYAIISLCPLQNLVSDLKSCGFYYNKVFAFWLFGVFFYCSGFLTAKKDFLKLIFR